MQSVSGRIFDLGKGALHAHQQGISVTGHNIANVNTPGYSRQRLILDTNEPFSSSTGQMATGVRAEEIQRIHDRFLTMRIKDENQALGKWEAMKETLDSVEMILNESSGPGLGRAMEEFWNAWQDLSNNPSGYTERMVLQSKGAYMADTFQRTFEDLKIIQKDLDGSISGAVEEINVKARQIAGLNLKITEFEIGGQNANDFRDRRDLILKELSFLIDTNAVEDEEGMLNVSVSKTGKPLVAKTSSWNLSTGTNSFGFEDIAWNHKDGSSTVLAWNELGGKTGGWLEARDVSIPDYLSRLETLGATIISKVNELHENGYGLADSGIPFHGDVFFSGSSASDMEVNPDIMSDVRRIAASKSLGGVPGENLNALDIAELQNDLVLDGNTTSFNNYYSGLVSSVGTGARNATANFNYQDNMTAHLENYRESISGVSLDEEMVELIKYQHAYSAAAKLITTSDEMLEVLMNMT